MSSSIIKVLSEAVANQIAAGEVVQRPASALKELMENAIDSGSQLVVVAVKDGGRTLLQVTDSGCGMSFLDARLCFDRHATSKIQSANDLFSIRTMGFRGEALASIASVAQVELKTKRMEDELGTQVIIEGTEVKGHEPCQCANGTSILMKNLFYNIPARRNFLKSDDIEYKHIETEFIRIALANPEISFQLFNNNNRVYLLETQNLQQRIVALYGRLKGMLLPVDEEVSGIQIHGFVGKPESAKKSRGEQFFFVNNRFFKNTYFNHAISYVFEGLMESGKFPSFFIYITIDPKFIDVNIHPTKTEISFEDERFMYNLLKTTVRKTIGKFHLSPELDFDQDLSIPISFNPSMGEVKAPTISIDENYNPFKQTPSTYVPSSGRSGFGYSESGGGRKESNNAVFQRIVESKMNFPQEEPQVEATPKQTDFYSGKDLFQVHGRYILSNCKSGMMLIDQHGAHHRVIYEQLKDKMLNGKIAVQQLLFPQTLHLSKSDLDVISILTDEIKNMGFDMEMQEEAILINGVPADFLDSDIPELFDNLIHCYQSSYSNLENYKSDILLIEVSKKMAIRYGRTLQQEEMKELCETLFQCREPHLSPSGKPTMQIIALDDIVKRFER